MTQPGPGLDGSSEPGRFFVEEAGLLVAAVLHIAQKEGKDIGWVVDLLTSSKREDVDAVIEKAIIDAPSEDMARDLRRFLTAKVETEDCPAIMRSWPTNAVIGTED